MATQTLRIERAGATSASFVTTLTSSKNQR